MNKLLNYAWASRLRRRVTIVALVFTLLLSSTGVVLSQATDNFDLGCRSALASGGGTIIHGANGSIGVLGQFAPGVTTTSAVGVRSGYMLPIPAKSVVSHSLTLANLTQTNDTYMPLLSKVIQILRGCQY